jgi:hypothetical protein
MPSQHSIRKNTIELNQLQYSLMIENQAKAAASVRRWNATGGIDMPSADTNPTHRAFGHPVQDGLQTVVPDWIKKNEEMLPWSQSLVLPAGQKAQPSQRAYGPEGFIDARLAFLESISNALGIPSKMVFSTRTGSSVRYGTGESEIVMRQLRDRIRSFHTKAEPLLAELLSSAWEGIVNSKIYQHASSKGKQKDPEYLKKKRSEAKVQFKFKDNPLQDYDLLKKLYDDGVMTADSFQKHALDLSGYSEQHRLKNMEATLISRVRKFSEAEASGKIKQQQHMLANKPTAQGNSSKSASSSSSSSSSSGISEGSNKTKRKSPDKPSSSSSSSSKGKNKKQRQT